MEFAGLSRQGVEAVGLFLVLDCRGPAYPTLQEPLVVRDCWLYDCIIEIDVEERQHEGE
jgi:hypothetical protein